jgi:hypothetical protein
LTDTLSSTIVGGVVENGRTYAAYGNEGIDFPFLPTYGSPTFPFSCVSFEIFENERQELMCITEYGLPIDEDELDRIDMSHAKYIVLLEKKLFLAPVSVNPQSILDLGTGTGAYRVDENFARPDRLI